VAVDHALQVRLDRGRSIEGTVRDAATGSTVAGARVEGSAIVDAPPSGGVSTEIALVPKNTRP
jgi:hypothetical protein